MRRMDAQQIGEAVRSAIVASGENRYSLSIRTGIAESSIRAIEIGHCPSVLRADEILRALGRSLVLGDPSGPALEIPPAKPSRKRSPRG